VPAINKEFDYLVPGDLRGQVRVGTQVRLVLNGRPVGGWITAVGVDPPAGLRLRPITKVRGWGPPAELVELAGWAAWRWAGRRATFLRTASPPVAVRSLPPPPGPVAPLVAPGGPADGLVADALSVAGGAGGPRPAVVRWPPASDPYPLVVEAASRALSIGGREPGGAGRRPTALIVGPDVAAARHLGLRLRRGGLPVAIVAHDRPGAAAGGEWARAAAGGCVVVGARAAAWAPAPDLALAVVLDEHDETLQEERAPTWHARDVVVERARRAGAPCLLVSPCPSLEARRAGTVLAPGRATERAGWPVVDVVDRRSDDPTIARSLISPRLAEAVASGARVVCMLNRTGRSRLSACAVCGDLARCEHCGAAVVADDDGRFRCTRCGTARPEVCASCGATRFKVLRPGVTRLREELEALAGEPVVELTGADSDTGDPVTARVVVGTEAVLHRVEFAEVVAYVDFDQELTAPRYRAAEQALALLVRGARLVGGRGGAGRDPAGRPGRLLVQTRIPDHVAIRAALHADPDRLAETEAGLRAALRFPPAAALALVSGPAAPAFAERAAAALAGSVDSAAVELLGPDDGAWLLRAPDHRALCDTLAAVARPPGRLRIEVNPPRI
jgi:primosomal protein N' (replication factor Y)